MNRKDTRPLTVNDAGWEYKIGRNTVAIYSPNNQRFFPKFWEIVGNENYEKKNYTLNPSVIADYIKKEILKDLSMDTCKYCNKKSADVVLRCNPLNAEIYGIYDKHLICDECDAAIAEEI